MKFRTTSLDEWNETRALLGESALKKLEKADMTIIDIHVLRRLLLLAGFTQDEIERAQIIGTKRVWYLKAAEKQHYKPITSKQELMDWLIKGALAYVGKPARSSSHQRRLVFSSVGNGGAELSESFWEQLEAQNADPDVEK